MSETLRTLSVMFYNVENFFDTTDDPAINDKDFLPDSELQWDEKKYNNKIQRIAEVIDSITTGNDLPEIIGLCEIEKVEVLEDLISKSLLRKKNYKALCATGQDDRGINVALLFNASLFELISSEEIDTIDPEHPLNKTRNMLHVQLHVMPLKEKLHVFVNHWPSRRAGEESTNFKRLFAAQISRKKIDEVLSAEPDAKIIFMGDLNDTPSNTSVKEILRANKHPDKHKSELFCPFIDMENKGEGTVLHDGEWEVFDNIILSDAFLNSEGLHYHKNSAGIHKKDFLLFKNLKTGLVKPNKNYTGTKYHNGYSDHLAVFIKLNLP